MLKDGGAEDTVAIERDFKGSLMNYKVINSIAAKCTVVRFISALV